MTEASGNQRVHWLNLKRYSHLFERIWLGLKHIVLIYKNNVYV